MAKAIDQKFAKLLKELECGICYQDVTDTRLCPHCSQIFCERCIYEWMDTSHDCPKCRVFVERCSLIKGRSTDAIMGSIKQLLADQDLSSKDHCGEHANQQVSMFCYSCMESICAKCFFSKEHTDHKEVVVLLDEAFKTYQYKLKIAMDGVSGRKEQIKWVLKELQDEERRLKNDVELIDDLEKESEALVAAEANPEKMKKIVETERLITELPEYTSKCVSCCGLTVGKKKELVLPLPLSTVKNYPLFPFPPPSLPLPPTLSGEIKNKNELTGKRGRKKKSSNCTNSQLAPSDGSKGSVGDTVDLRRNEDSASASDSVTPAE